VAPELNALNKTHKEDKPIRPVNNNIQAPSYTLAKYLNKKQPINKTTIYSYIRHPKFKGSSARSK
jgi:hypothetical protein